MGNSKSTSKSMPADDAPRGEHVMYKLMKENAKYVEGRHKNHQDVPLKRKRLARDGQVPVAAVIACADSRVAPEIMFRATIGELFVIRTAGNVTWGDEVEGSLQYAVNHLNVPLVLVLGHSKCGAVGAACTGGDPLPGALGKHISEITKGLNAQGGIPEKMELAVEKNVRYCVNVLRSDSEGFISEAESRGVVVLGAVYNISTGKVNIVGMEEEEEEAKEETKVDVDMIEKEEAEMKTEKVDD